MVRNERGRKRVASGAVKKTGNRKAPAARSSPAVDGESDWRDQVLSQIRKLILEADPRAVEERKWKKPSSPDGVPVWSRDGIICTGETYKAYIKLTFAKGAALKDPSRLFNASLEGNARRAIDIREGDEIDEEAFKELVRAAVRLNSAGDG